MATKEKILNACNLKHTFFSPDIDSMKPVNVDIRKLTWGEVHFYLCFSFDFCWFVYVGTVNNLIIEYDNTWANINWIEIISNKSSDK